MKRLGDWRLAVGAIYRKELKDTLRDRRTLATMLLVPMVVYPLLVLVTSEAFSASRASEQARKAVVRLYAPVPPEVTRALETSGEILVLSGTATAAIEPATTSTALSRSARRQLAATGAHVVLVPSSSIAALLAEHGTARIQLYFDETDPFAHTAVSRVEDTLVSAATELRDQRMRALGVPPSAARPLALETRSIATTGEIGGHLASIVLPVLILFFVALSCFYPAVDVTAGEKERGTLATLLTAPIRPIHIVWGKYLAVVTVGTLAGLLNVLVISVTMLRAVAGMTKDLRASWPALHPTAVLGILFAVVLLAALVGATMMVAASLARSFQDASNLLTPVMLVIIAPALLAALPDTALTPGWAAVPVAGGVLLMKALFLGRTDLGPTAVAIGATIAYTALLLFLAARVFQDERVLFSTEGRRANLRGLLLEPPPPGAGTALALAAVLFVGNYYGGLLGSVLSPLVAVSVTQVVINAGAAIALALWVRRAVPPAELLALSAPPPRALLGGALVGMGAWLGLALPALWIQELLVPGQGEVGKRMEEALGLREVALPWLILGVAVVPALCEELAFRGAMLGLLRGRMTPRAGLVLQAVIFGVMHGSLFRFAPTALLGLLLGMLRLRTRSLWPGVLAHALSNGILVALERAAPPEVKQALGSPSPWPLAGLALVALGLLLARGGLADEERSRAG